MMRESKTGFGSVGKDVAIAYGVFLFAALFLNFVSADDALGVNLQLTSLLSGGMGVMGEGRGIFLALLASATIAVPFFWKNKFAPLAFTVPLIVTIIALWPLYEQHREQQQAMAAMGEFGPLFEEMAEQMGGGGGLLDSLGPGAWAVIASALYLAVRGVMKILSHA
jgi:hypothetical protein